VPQKKDAGAELPSNPTDVVVDEFEPWQPEVTPPQLATVETWLKPDTIEAGNGTSTVTCMGYDAIGNYVGVGPSHLDTPEEVTVAGKKLSSIVAGQYEIQCVPDAAVEAELVPATLTVLTSQPISLELSLKPDKKVYVVDKLVTVSGKAADKYGNVVEDTVLAGLKITPSKLGTVSGKKITFKSEGKGKISAHVSGADSVSDSVDIQVDAGAPKIEITYPPRASELEGEGSIMVEGYVKDSTGLKTAKLNGKSFDTSATGFFAMEIQPKYGLNVLTVEAEDKLGNTTRHLQSFLFSESYYPIPDAPLKQQLVSDGIVIWLDYDAFMGGNGPDGTSFSYIATEFLLALDLSTLIPNPAASQSIAWCTYDVYLSNLSFGKPDIQLKPHPKGLSVHVKFPDLYADLEGTAPWVCPDFTGNITAQAVTIDTMAYLDIDSQGKLDVSLGDVLVQFVGLNIDLYGITGAIAEAVLVFFEDTLTQMIEEQFEAQISLQFEEQIQKLLGNIYIDQTLELPPFMPGAPFTFAEVHLRPVGLAPSYSGMELALDASFTANDKKKQGLYGPPARSGCMKGKWATAKVEGKHYMEVGLHLDVLNQSAYTKYLEKGIDFEMDADDMAAMGSDTSELGVEDLAIKGSAQLPPVMTDCDPDGELRIELGDLKLDVKLTMLGMPLEMTLYLYLVAKIELEIVGPIGDQYVELTFGDVDWMDIHLDSLNEEWAGNEALFAELIEESFLSEFVNVIQEFPYIVPVSQMPLDDLMPSSPGWAFIPVVDEIQVKPGYLLIKAHLLLED